MDMKTFVTAQNLFNEIVEIEKTIERFKAFDPTESLQRIIDNLEAHLHVKRKQFSEL